MLKSCQYCGRIHDSKFDCGKKPQKKRNISEADRFRWSGRWQKKRQEIKERDDFICQICVRGIYNPERKFETDNLSVHHMIPVEKNWDKRLDNDNLLTVCEGHHAMAERGSIPKETIKKIICEQEAKGQDEKSVPPGVCSRKKNARSQRRPTNTRNKFPDQDFRAPAK